MVRRSQKTKSNIFLNQGYKASGSCALSRRLTMESSYMGTKVICRRKGEPSYREERLDIGHN